MSNYEDSQHPDYDPADFSMGGRRPTNRSSSSSSGGGLVMTVIKGSFALAGLCIFSGGLAFEGYQGAAVAGAFGGGLGFCVGALLSMLASLFGSPKGCLMVAVPLGVLFAVPAAIVGPKVSHNIRVSQEESEWEEASEAGTAAAWRDYEQTVPETFRREGFPVEMMKARVADAVKAHKATELRKLVAEIKEQQDQEAYEPALQAARESLEKLYQQAFEKLGGDLSQSEESPEQMAARLEKSYINALRVKADELDADENDSTPVRKLIEKLDPEGGDAELRKAFEEAAGLVGGGGADAALDRWYQAVREAGLHPAGNLAYVNLMVRELAISLENMGLKRAFAKVMLDLAQQESAEVLVVFTNQMTLEPPPGTQEQLEAYRQDPAALEKYPEGDAPVISEGEAFSKAFAERRRETFLKAMRSSFEKVFSGELLELVPADPDTELEGNLMFKVNSHIHRGSNFFTYTQEGEFTGLLFGIYVEWSFQVFDRDGKLLFENRIVSNPATQLRLNSQPGDPDWAPYSVLMDSAYDNYARRIITLFGLEPPPQKQVFSFQPAEPEGGSTQ